MTVLSTMTASAHANCELLQRNPGLLDDRLPRLLLAADKFRRLRGRCLQWIHAMGLELFPDRRLLENGLQILTYLADDKIRGSSPRHQCEPRHDVEVGNGLGDCR